MDTSRTAGSVVVIAVTTDGSTVLNGGPGQVEVAIDVTVLAEHLAPRRTRACLTVGHAAVPRIHPGAELAADLDVGGHLVTLHVPSTQPTNTTDDNDPTSEHRGGNRGDHTPWDGTTPVPTFETTNDTAWRQS